jgi:hypothetical protein
MKWNGVALGPVKGCECSGGTGLGVLKAMGLVDDEDGPGQIVKKGDGTPRGIE